MRTVKIVKHYLWQKGNPKRHMKPYWKVYVELSNGNDHYDNHIVELHFEYYNWGSEGWWLGYMKDFHKPHSNEWIEFGYSNYHNQLKYIFNAMLRILQNDDWTYVMKNQFCIEKPEGVTQHELPTDKDSYYRPNKVNINFIQKELNEAERIAYKLYPNNESLRTAFIKGYEYKMKE